MVQHPPNPQHALWHNSVHLSLNSFILPEFARISRFLRLYEYGMGSYFVLEDYPSSNPFLYLRLANEFSWLLGNWSPQNYPSYRLHTTILPAEPHHLIVEAMPRTTSSRWDVSSLSAGSSYPANSTSSLGSADSPWRCHSSSLFSGVCHS